jgi:glycosyltransferase involved in cell wall biosynthesis
MEVPLQCTVVIPTYNREKLLRHTLESLTRQTLPRNRFEVLVVDDGSSDGTRQMVEGFRERLCLRYFFQEDLGFRAAAARNIGIAHARGEVCAFIDSGLQLHAGCLAAHVARHASAPAPIAVVGYVYGFNENNEDAEALAEDIDIDDPTATIDRFARQRRWLDVREAFYAKYGDDFGDLPAPWLVFWTCNVSARTERIRAIDAFDEAFRTWGVEDMDLGYRLHLHGARLVLDRDAAAIHLPHPKKRGPEELRNTANHRYMADKYDTPITRLIPEYGDPYTFNDLILERGLPRCADYLAQRRQPAGTEAR